MDTRKNRAYRSLRTDFYYFLACKRQIQYRKSSIKPPPPGGAYLFQTHLRDGGLIKTRGLFNLAKTMISVLHKELQYKVEMLKYKKLEVMKPRIKNKSKLPVGE